MKHVLLFALFTSPAWILTLASLVTSHRPDARLDLTMLPQVNCLACAKSGTCQRAHRDSIKRACNQFVPLAA
jgi:hypothetical protein